MESSQRPIEQTAGNLDTPRDFGCEVRRVLKAPPRVVFRAWTDPEFARRWSWGVEHETIGCSIDLRVGGMWTHRLRNTGTGEQWFFDGRFTEVIPDQRIAHTFHWKSDRGIEHPESMVTIDFRALGDDTEVVIRHVRIATCAERDGTHTGWNDCLDQITLCLPDAAPC